MKLVIGLGNPGRKYEKTRHNIGFDILRQVAARQAAAPGKHKFGGELQECALGGQRVLLLQPHTFMNLSGQSVRQAVDFYNLAVADCLLVCDDFHLPLGTLRMRARGSDGGQKGLADTIRHLGTNALARLRFGIGPVPPQWDPANYVLGKFDASQSQILESEILRAAQAVETWVADGIEIAMNKFNGGLEKNFG